MCIWSDDCHDMICIKYIDCHDRQFVWIPKAVTRNNRRIWGSLIFKVEDSWLQWAGNRSNGCNYTDWRLRIALVSTNAHKACFMPCRTQQEKVEELSVLLLTIFILEYLLSSGYLNTGVRLISSPNLASENSIPSDALIDISAASPRQVVDSNLVNGSCVNVVTGVSRDRITH